LAIGYAKTTLRIMTNKFLWFLFIFFAVGIGLYPLLAVTLNLTEGFISTKQPEVTASLLWQTAFYLHISFGGISLLTGWSQFIKTFRARNLAFHRTLGKIYLISVMISGLCGLYIAFFATGGLISSLGFGGLAMAWLFTSSAAYKSIKAKDIDSHEKWMIRSYALTFAAVTLRIYLPLSIVAGFDFVFAYRIISFMCWVPNMVIAELLIYTMARRVLVTSV
jgi:hypothetical protein